MSGLHMFLLIGPREKRLSFWKCKYSDIFALLNTNHANVKWIFVENVLGCSDDWNLGDEVNIGPDNGLVPSWWRHHWTNTWSKIESWLLMHLLDFLNFGIPEINFFIRAFRAGKRSMGDAWYTFCFCVTYKLCYLCVRKNNDSNV